jgi:hypothetical protein
VAHGTLEELVEAGERLVLGLPFSPELDDALTYGTAIGGARPEALLWGQSLSELRNSRYLPTPSHGWKQKQSEWNWHDDAV